MLTMLRSVVGFLRSIRKMLGPLKPLDLLNLLCYVTAPNIELSHASMIVLLWSKNDITCVVITPLLSYALGITRPLNEVKATALLYLFFK